MGDFKNPKCGKMIEKEIQCLKTKFQINEKTCFVNHTIIQHIIEKYHASNLKALFDHIIPYIFSFVSFENSSLFEEYSYLFR